MCRLDLSFSFSFKVDCPYFNLTFTPLIHVIPKVIFHICFALFDLVVEYISLFPTLVQDTSICRTVTPSAAMGIIAPRDFVDVILVKKYEDGTISSNGAS